MTTKKFEITGERLTKLPQVVTAVTITRNELVGLQSQREFMVERVAKQRKLLDQLNNDKVATCTVLDSYLTLMVLLEDFLNVSEKRIAMTENTLKDVNSLLGV